MTSIVAESTSALPIGLSARKAGMSAFVIVALFIAGFLTSRILVIEPENDLLLDSTMGELAVWMADQTGEDDIESFFVRLAENRAQTMGQDRLDSISLLVTMRSILIAWTLAITACAGLGFLMIYVDVNRAIVALVAAVLGLDGLLFILPDPTFLSWVILAVVALLISLVFGPGRISHAIGFIIALSVLFVAWETGKSFAASVNYKITLPQPAWQYSSYPTIEDALDGLNAGEVSAVVLDRRDLAEQMAPFPDDIEVDLTSMAYPNLRYLDDLEGNTSIGPFPIEPAFSGRLALAVQADAAAAWQSVGDLSGEAIGTVDATFAQDNYLAQERRLVLVDFKILNDLNLPHLQTIAEAFMQPARRNGSRLMLEILGDAAAYTWGEALFGFLFGAGLGFVLGTLFAHSALLERSILPYVVASQTVPILAIAPVVVIWLGPSQVSVAVIAAYITFFPVTINTLRGLLSPKPTEVELLQSYAASRWGILWKLRFPAALPHIFTALKVSATASVVGAIIGELPSGIGDGLARAILDFSSDYSLVSTPKLWAAIISAAAVGIIFFVSVSLIEQLVLGRYLNKG